MKDCLHGPILWGLFKIRGNLEAAFKRDRSTESRAGGRKGLKE